jgi:hypothetical protein
MIKQETFEGENFYGSVESEHLVEKTFAIAKSRIGGWENFHRWLSNNEIHESFLP